jgi:hypothetical protein
MGSKMGSKLSIARTTVPRWSRRADCRNLCGTVIPVGESLWAMGAARAPRRVECLPKDLLVSRLPNHGIPRRSDFLDVGGAAVTVSGFCKVKPMTASRMVTICSPLAPADPMAPVPAPAPAPITASLLPPIVPSNAAVRAPRASFPPCFCRVHSPIYSMYWSGEGRSCR